MLCGLFSREGYFRERVNLVRVQYMLASFMSAPRVELNLFKEIKYKMNLNTVRAQDLTSPENRPLSNISRVRSKECRQTSKKCRHFIKRKLSIDRG